MTIIQDTRKNIYETSRLDGMGGNIIFSIGVVYIMWHSFKYMDDVVPKFKKFWQHIFFLLGLALDITGIGLTATGFSKYGGANPQEGTAYHTSGLFGILVGSILVIYSGVQEENNLRILENMKEPQQTIPVVINKKENKELEDAV
jgi:hypothetical protein